MSEAAIDRVPVVLKTAPMHARVWHGVFAEEAPDLALLDWAADASFPGISYFAGWQPPADLPRQMPDLDLLFSVAAGLDHLPIAALPPHVRIVRMIAPDMTRSMVEFVVMGVLALHRDLVPYAAETRQGVWTPRFIRTARSTTVGFLGLGVLGRAAAEAVAGLDFRVRGWSASPKSIPGIACFAGADALPDFLGACDILVCLLPLTERTRDILGSDLFRHLPQGAKLLNVGRGGHLVEADLLAALDGGRISAAILDVLREEPPPPGHPLLAHPHVLVTPHSASASQPDDAARQMIAAVRAARAGEAVPNLVDRARLL